MKSVHLIVSRNGHLRSNASWTRRCTVDLGHLLAIQWLKCTLKPSGFVGSFLLMLTSLNNIYSLILKRQSSIDELQVTVLCSVCYIIPRCAFHDDHGTTRIVDMISLSITPLQLFVVLFAGCYPISYQSIAYSGITGFFNCISIPALTCYILPLKFVLTRSLGFSW